MASELLHEDAQVQCTHGAQVSTSASSTRVKVSGKAVVTSSDSSTVSGCLNTVGTKYQPCAKVQWSSAARRVKVMGKAVLLKDSSGQCQSGEQITQGSPNVVSTQTRVKGT